MATVQTSPARGRHHRVPLVVDLHEARAVDGNLVGAKAAALARAARARLPVLPGFVVTTAWAGVAGARERSPGGDLHRRWRALSEDGRRPLVARSSSPIEDGHSSSMAGLFASVLDVRGWTPFTCALDTVLASVNGAVADAPMAVLVQPFLDAVEGGVMFGADPVSGRMDRMVLAMVRGGPDRLVSGAVDGEQYVLSRRGRLIDGPGDPGRFLRRELSRLARRAAATFGGPQDIEWARDRDGHLWLLQSRPITATGSAARATGPVLGPGPVAETFPDPLSPLEEDLWVAPLRTALRHAVTLTGAASRRRAASSPVVVSVGGRVAADLDLLGERRARASFWSRLNPRPPARRLVAAWRVGRLRAALPALATDVIDRVDEDLLAVPSLAGLSNARLLSILRRSQDALVAAHGYEVLIGLLVSHDASTPTGASLALRALAAGRAEGWNDDEIVRRSPVTLTLVPPAIGASVTLPAWDGPLPPSVETDDRVAILREALRIRARWLQELSARAAWELGERLARAGILAAPEQIRMVRLDELAATISTSSAPVGLAGRRAVSSPPLPAAFRLTPDNEVIPVRHDGAGDGLGRGAGGGRGVGTAHPLPDGAATAAAATATDGEVLVVRTLDPGLAPLLPHLSGLVAETGSVLSHLAILAREMHVPVVVGVPDALSRFPAGSTVLVDGATGEVTLVEQPRSVA